MTQARKAALRLASALRHGGAVFVAKRVAERARARLCDGLGVWARLAARLEKAPPRAARALFHADAGPVLRALCRDAPDLRRAILDRGAYHLRRDFKVLGHPVPPDGPWPWHSDWSIGHQWPAVAPYRINFYGDGTATPDPKVPFELSRFAFLTQASLAAAVANTQDRAPYLKFVRDTLADWAKTNPPGQAMTWYPMEPSVRCLALAQIHELSRLADAPEEDLAAIRRLMALSAAYVRVNHERAAVSNSHYLANLVCLAVAGAMLEGSRLPVRRWRRWARDGLNREIPAQFNADGGNFEGSAPYHLASLELCLLAHAALKRAGDSLDATAEARLKAALAYAAGIADDAHQMPAFGDNDDSHYLVADLRTPWDVRPALALGAALTGQAVEAPAGQCVSAALFAAPEPGPIADPKPIPFCFPETGLAGVRTTDLYLAMDAGPVGLGGQGGHGHNDLTAFVFRAEGQDLIVDRGCSSYVRDQNLRNAMRAGSAHAVLLPEDQDLGGLDAGPFRIIDPAAPIPPQVESKGTRYSVTCGHDGFAGIAYQRALVLDSTAAVGAWRLQCTDRLVSASGKAIPFSVRRYFPLAPGLKVTPASDGQSARITCARSGALWQMTWTPASQTRVIEQKHHTRYDQAEPAWTLCITSTPPADAKDWVLDWTLAPHHTKGRTL